MDIKVTPAAHRTKPLIEHMMQRYFAELENFSAIGTNDQGLYAYAYLDDYWTDTAKSFPFLIAVNGRIAGFALVSTHSRLGNEDTHSISEFYVSPEVRRYGVGTRAAREIFRQFRGNWEVAVLEQNQLARSFWEHAIRSPEIDNVQIHLDIWKGPIYSFNVCLSKDRA